jgi:putative glutamine amidotransferase
MTTRKPVIGITPSPMEDKQAHGTFTRYAMATTYTEAVEAAGGVPIVIPPQAGNIEEILSVVDGLLISGGGDIDPQRYGDAEMHEKTYGIHHGRDDLEIALVQEAVARDIPMLCICRGIQVLNVALGGTLIQDVPGQYSTEIEHAQQNAGITKEEPGHTVSVTPGSLLERTYGQSTIEVNSFHHQAIKDLASDLQIDGVAPDEVVEAVNRPGSNWILGVQWHPEMMFRAHPEHLRPFSALVEQASRKTSAALS